MPIKIIAIEQKRSWCNDPILKHLSIEKFKWINEETQRIGISIREALFHWIVNQKGSAYVQKKDGGKVFVFGAVRNERKYVRCIENQKWSDDLLDLPQL
jgi:hypothetical protein